MELTVIPLQSGQSQKRLGELENQKKIETIQNTAWLKSAEILCRVLIEFCCHLNSCKWTSASTGMRTFRPQHF